MHIASLGEIAPCCSRDGEPRVKSAMSVSSVTARFLGATTRGSCVLDDIGTNERSRSESWLSSSSSQSWKVSTIVEERERCPESPSLPRSSTISGGMLCFLETRVGRAIEPKVSPMRSAELAAGGNR